MKKFKHTISAFLVLVTLGISSVAHAFSISGVGNMMTETGTLTPVPGVTLNSDSSSLGFGGGVLIDYDFLPILAIQSGLLYQTRSITLNFSTFTDQQTQNFFQIPFVARFKLLPFLDAGAGLYLANGVGNITDNISTAAAPSVVTSNSNSWETDGINRFDWGWTASVAGYYPILPMMSIVGDIRYNFSLTNPAKSTAIPANISFRYFTFLLGVRFSL